MDLAFERLDDAIAAGYTLVDVRELDEIAAQPLLVPSRPLPFTQIEARASELAQGRMLLVCTTGRRSGHSARSLRKKGMCNIHSLAGGIAAILPARDHVSG